MSKSKLVRAAEWMDALPSMLRANKFPIIMILIVVVCTIVCAGLLIHLNRQGANNTDALQKQILEDVAREREEMNRKIGELQAELTGYREQLQALDDEIRRSAEERERDNEAIKNATSISDVDDVVYKRTGTKRKERTVNAVLKRPASSESAPGGMGANPY